MQQGEFTNMHTCTDCGAIVGRTQRKTWLVGAARARALLDGGGRFGGLDSALPGVARDGGGVQHEQEAQPHDQRVGGQEVARALHREGSRRQHLPRGPCLCDLPPDRLPR